MASNIVKFPGIKRDHPLQTTEDFARELLSSKMNYANELCDHYAAQLVNKFGMHGFEIDSEQFMKDFAFTVETMRSNLYRSLAISHPFHEMIDEATDASMDFENYDEEYDEDDDAPDPETDLL